jgi:hypothetical protein
LVTQHDLSTALRRMLVTSRATVCLPAVLVRVDSGIVLLCGAHEQSSTVPTHTLETPRVFVCYRSRPTRPVWEEAVALLAQRGTATPAAALIFSGEGATARLDGQVRLSSGAIVALDQLRVVGGGMPVLRAGNLLPLSLPGLVPERFSRTIGALEPGPWQQLCSSRTVFNGCGRTASLLIRTRALHGGLWFGLLDPDVIEPHNLDAMDGVESADIGKFKVEALANHVHRVWPAQSPPRRRCR